MLSALALGVASVGMVVARVVRGGGGPKAVAERLLRRYRRRVTI